MVSFDTSWNTPGRFTQQLVEQAVCFEGAIVAIGDNLIRIEKQHELEQFGKNSGMLFKKGKIIKKVSVQNAIQELCAGLKV